MSDPLADRLKQLIVDILHLEDIRPEDIKDEEPLIGSGLALDSVDMLELVLKIEKDYGIKIKSAEESRAALASVSTLAAFVRARAKPGSLPN